MCLRAEEGVRIADKTVLKMMRQMGLRCGIRRERPYHRYNSYKGEVGQSFENVIGRDFKADGPWQKLGTDVTEFKLSFGKAYLCLLYTSNIMTGELSAMLAAYTVFHSGSRRLIIHTDSLGALTFVLRLAHSRWAFEAWVSEGIQDERVVSQMRALTQAIREKRVLVKHVTGHTGHGLQESSDSVSKMHRHFPGQIVDKRHQSEFNQRCESIITALSGCALSLIHISFGGVE